MKMVKECKSLTKRGRCAKDGTACCWLPKSSLSICDKNGKSKPGPKKRGKK